MRGKEKRQYTPEQLNILAKLRVQSDMELINGGAIYKKEQINKKGLFSIFRKGETTERLEVTKEQIEDARVEMDQELKLTPDERKRKEEYFIEINSSSYDPQLEIDEGFKSLDSMWSNEERIIDVGNGSFILNPYNAREKTINKAIKMRIELMEMQRQQRGTPSKE